MFDILKQFNMKGAVISCEPYGNGHINRTWLVCTDAGARYILQRINDKVFPNVPLLMGNIEKVTGYLHNLGLDERHALSLVPVQGGARWMTHECADPELAGHYRMYDFVEGSLCLERAESLEDFRQSGAAFGNFQMLLKDFPAETLGEVIPAFHDTPSRCAQLRASIEANVCGRAAESAREIDFAMARLDWAGGMQTMLKRGELPLRVTHNDTKLNNVLLDGESRKPLCVIDLDTVMPGLSGHDFGDSIRFGANTCAEDETDLDKVQLSLDHFRAYAEGFIRTAGGALTDAELATLPMGAQMMTYECGIRFLADHLAGDVYFRIHRPGHNLDRARNQFKLVADMERKYDDMLKIIREISGRKI